MFYLCRLWFGAAVPHSCSDLRAIVVASPAPAIVVKAFDMPCLANPLVLMMENLWLTSAERTWF
jgi:hypothetical protein